jgi:hypothetical protein
LSKYTDAVRPERSRNEPLRCEDSYIAAASSLRSTPPSSLPSPAESPRWRARRAGLAGLAEPGVLATVVGETALPTGNTGAVSDGFELIGGREKRDIRVVAYDPDWRRRFVEQRVRIAAALGATALRIDHVGSTSVPGLVAKPIIDIDLSVPAVEDESAWLLQLVDAGYLLRVREPGHRMVHTADRGVHVHVCSAGSDWSAATCCSVIGSVTMPVIVRRMASSSANSRGVRGLT